MAPALTVADAEHLHSAPEKWHNTSCFLGKRLKFEQVSPNKIHVFIDALNLSDPVPLFQSNLYRQARE